MAYSNLSFKTGLQSKLDEIRKNKSAVEGAFYLTSDSHRLYVGHPVAGGVDAVPVNEGITTVTTLDELKNITSSALTAGEFYYVTGTADDPVNILCVNNGKGWVQINPDTDTHVTGVSYSVAVANNTATLNVLVKDNTDAIYGNEEGVAPITLTGAGGLTISNNGTDITLTGNEYTLTDASDNTSGNMTQGEFKVKLSSSNNSSTSSAVLKAGANINISHDSNGTTIKAQNTTLTSESVETGTGNNSIAAPSANGFFVKVTDSDGVGNSATLDPMVVLGTHTDTTYHFVDGTASLPVYTKDEIDTKINGLNSMTYMGTVGVGGSRTSLPTTNVRSGDTYLVVGESVFTNLNPDTLGSGGKPGVASAGDLVIARGAETNGVITGTITWDVVPSGDDATSDTNYKTTAIDNGLKLSTTTGSDVGALTVVGDGTYTIVSDSKSQDTTSNEVTIAHATITKNNTNGSALTQTAQDDLTFTAVTNVTYNDAGHVTGIETTEITVKDTATHVSSVANTLTKTVVNNKQTVAINNSVTTTDAGGTSESADSTLELVSNTLALTATNATETANAALAINLVWDTF